MYNLFVSADPDEWKGQPFVIDISRCIRGYSDSEISDRLAILDDKAITILKSFPCLFAYENSCQQSAKMGIITGIKKRQNIISVRYEIQNDDFSLTVDDLNSLKFELDIERLELNRTHWAVKNVDLKEELRQKGFKTNQIPEAIPPVNIRKHKFEVALSFPGDARHIVEPVAEILNMNLGFHSCFYDNNYTSQLATPSLDVLLQDIYRNRSKLVVLFLSGDYQRKDWCGVEFRAIKEIIMDRDLHDRVMLFRVDHGHVDGIFKTDGYIDCANRTAHEIASLIMERSIVINDLE